MVSEHLQEYYVSLLTAAMGTLGVEEQLCWQCRENLLLLRAGRYDTRILSHMATKFEECLKDLLNDRAHALIDTEEFLIDLHRFSLALQWHEARVPIRATEQ
jgi:hypothetical protein